MKRTITLCIMLIIALGGALHAENPNRSTMRGLFGSAASGAIFGSIIGGGKGAGWGALAGGTAGALIGSNRDAQRNANDDNVNDNDFDDNGPYYDANGNYIGMGVYGGGYSPRYANVPNGNGNGAHRHGNGRSVGNGSRGRR